MRAAPARSNFRRPGPEACWSGWIGTIHAGTSSCRNPSVPLCLRPIAGFRWGLPLDLALLRGVDLLPLAITQQDGLDLTVQKLPRLGLTGVEPIVIDQECLVL